MSAEVMLPTAHGPEAEQRPEAVEATATGPVSKAFLRAFVNESNRIEGIRRAPMRREIDAHERLLACKSLSVGAVEAFVNCIAPGHCLRRSEGLDVRVGRHIAPAGGYSIQVRLFSLLGRANDGADPYDVHCRYEYLHPFTDGNGRSGRALWLWMMLRHRGPWGWMVSRTDVGAELHLSFLHAFYYQTLDALSDGPKGQGKDGDAVPGGRSPTEGMQT